jgi:hypothetical protein
VGLHVVGDAARWDARRNTSARKPVAHDALRLALEACADFRRREPRHAAWIANGAPPVTSQAEHVRLFGQLWQAPQRRKAAAR